MANIHGYGVHIPRYRITQAEINRAWGRPGGRGEKAVAPPDEDAFTLGVKAARRALAQADLKGESLGAIYFASTSTGYAENAFAAQLASICAAEGDVSAVDFTLSSRATAAALQACVNALNAGRIEYGLVVAGEKLSAEPGSSYELSYGAGAGAILIGRTGFVTIEGIASHTSGFVGRFRPEGEAHGLVDERFVMEHGFLAHTREAVSRLLNVMGVTLDEFDAVVLQAPDARWGMRALKKLGLSSERLISTLPQVGYVGCASLLIDLALAFEQAKEGQLLLIVSYGPGGSDALALRISHIPPKAGVEAQIEEKELISYPVYLRYHGLLGGRR